jgi:hypothetical protein
MASMLFGFKPSLFGIKAGSVHVALGELVDA